MTRPIHETMRAAGQGLLCGTLMGAPICLGVVYFGLAGLLGTALATGAGLITAANALKRREQRQCGGAR